MAYARELMKVVPDQLSFAAVHPFFGYGRLSAANVHQFLDRTEAQWASGGVPTAEQRGKAFTALLALRPQLLSKPHANAVYIQASPNNLNNQRLIARILKKEHARFICLVHDLIPLLFPEYARPNGAILHRKRIETIARFADGIVCNSAATLDHLEPWLRTGFNSSSAIVAHLGVSAPSAVAARGSLKSERPYFVCVGTIEPRKNHLLLLNIWRQMSEERGPRNVPKLLLFGRRGWENEQVVDMLERCEALKGCVEEHGGQSDARVLNAMAGARALLLPSFAEGYGMPVTEALSLRVPVICSDLPAVREAGGSAVKLLDPLDGKSWREVIEDYGARPLQSIDLDAAGWTAPKWSQHVDAVIHLAGRLVA